MIKTSRDVPRNATLYGHNTPLHRRPKRRIDKRGMRVKLPFSKRSFELSRYFGIDRLSQCMGECFGAFIDLCIGGTFEGTAFFSLFPRNCCARRLRNKRSQRLRAVRNSGGELKKRVVNPALESAVRTLRVRLGKTGYTSAQGQHESKGEFDLSSHTNDESKGLLNCVPAIKNPSQCRAKED